VVLLHGYPDNSSVWDAVAERLATRFHVVRYDTRGTGGSDAPTELAGYRLDHLAADLAAVVRAVSPDAPVHLVGHDWGSVQGWHAVTDHAHGRLFASFTTIAGPCIDHVGSWMRGGHTDRRLRPVLRQMLRSWYIGAFQVPVLPELVMSFPLVRHGFGADRRDAVNGIQLYRANMTGPRRGTRRTDVPVLQLALARDPYVVPELLAAAEPFCTSLWRQSLPFGHWAPRTHPTTIAERVADFVQHIEGAPARRELLAARVTGDPGREFGGRLILITGAGSGIGRATALAFAAAGSDILAVDIDEATAVDTANAVRGLGVAGHAYVADVADATAMRKLADHVRAEHAVPDIVMANAGIGMAGPFLDTSEDDWRRVVDVNLLGVVHTLRAFAPMLVARGRGGHLVITASAAAFTPWPILSAYATTKAAVLSLAQSLRT
jgi:pimeloyl-ACP methyl ester carboxylesterase